VVISYACQPIGGECPNGCAELLVGFIVRNGIELEQWLLTGWGSLALEDKTCG
jgi:hypothetical protein